jgi:hypothetical protein
MSQRQTTGRESGAPSSATTLVLVAGWSWCVLSCITWTHSPRMIRFTNWEIGFRVHGAPPLSGG